MSDQVKTLRRRSKQASSEPSPPPESEPSRGHEWREYAGIPLGDRPGNTVPTLPVDLADIDDRLLMQLFSKYIAWQNYIATRVTEAEIAEANAQTELTVAQSTAMVKSWTGTREDRVAMAKAERDLHPEVRGMQDRYDTARAHRKMLSTLADNMERAAMVVSRELTRRVGREPVERRHRGWTP